MKNSAHDKQMTEVYDHIYDDFYDFKSDSMESARETIINNLSEAGVDLSLLPDLNVLNVGTGREALIFHQLGSKNIFHFDISDRSVKNLQKLSQSSGFNNIYSNQRDVCESGALGLKNEIDFVYLNGVLHHLHESGIAANNISDSLRPGARVFFRIYRSGSLGFFVVDFIRRFIGYDDFQLTSSMAAERFGHVNDPAGMYSDVIDDFFVPVLRLFDPNQLNNFFIQSGFCIIGEQKFIEYDHSDAGEAGQGRSLYYEYTGDDTSGMPANQFPGTIDQLHGIDYSESFIKKTVSMMDLFLERAETFSPASKIELSLSLYEESQTYRRVEGASARDNHGRLQNILEKFLHSKRIR